MRVFLQSFRLPGEAQKIDRIMEALAHAFHRANPGPFAHPDATYVLAFSIIMLNTDLHSSKIAVEKKMSLESFCRQAEGINGTTDLPHSMLEEIYYAIKGDEIRMLGGGEETTLSRAGWKHLGDADAKGPDAVALQGRSSPGLGARAGGATTVGTSATACVHQAADDAALEHAMLHSRGLGGHILTHVCWAPTMGALGSAARTAAARAESDNARRRAEAKQQVRRAPPCETRSHLRCKLATAAPVRSGRAVQAHSNEWASSASFNALLCARPTSAKRRPAAVENFNVPLSNAYPTARGRSCWLCSRMSACRYPSSSRRT